MPKTTSVSEAKNKLSAMMQWAVEHGDGVVIESRGQPMAVIVSFGEYEELMALRERERRRQALAQLEELTSRVQARNADLNDEEAEALADEIVRETIERMVEKETVRFKT